MEQKSKIVKKPKPKVVEEKVEEKKMEVVEEKMVVPVDLEKTVAVEKAVPAGGDGKGEGEQKAVVGVGEVVKDGGDND